MLDCEKRDFLIFTMVLEEYDYGLTKVSVYFKNSPDIKIFHNGFQYDESVIKNLTTGQETKINETHRVSRDFAFKETEQNILKTLQTLFYNGFATK